MASAVELILSSTVTRVTNLSMAIQKEILMGRLILEAVMFMFRNTTVAMLDNGQKLLVGQPMR